MSDGWSAFTEEIRNKMNKEGIFRPDERIVLTTKSCVLLEHFTGKAYSYRMVDLHTLKAKRLFSRTTPLPEAGYRSAIEKTVAHSGNGASSLHEIHVKASELLTHIFYDILQ